MLRYLLAIGMLVLAACGADDTSSDSSDPAAPPAETDTASTLLQNPAKVDAARLAAADTDAVNWMATGRTYGEQRFSPLDAINEETVGRLGLAWSFDLETKLGTQATPLVIDGVMYTVGKWNIIHALDAATGEELWSYDPETNRAWTRYACCGPTNRGLAAWNGKLYEGTLDGRLIAVDARSGALVWEQQTTPTDQPYSITGAPRVFNGKVVIGNGGGELGVRGYATAYDAETGEQLWRFWTVPGDPAKGFENDAMEMAAKTWTGEWWITGGGGGGNPWDSFSYDPELNLLYIGTGNGSPWARDLRSPGGGDNLFLSSIVAVDADTGEYRWHYQEVPGENWDYNATQQMILADIAIGGQPRKVLMQAAKNGFFYVLDRETGELLSASNFVKTTWASHVDLETGRPVEISDNLYSATQAKLVSPAPFGAHVWQPMAYSPETGLAYFSGQETSFAYSHLPADTYEHRPMMWNLAQNPDAAPPDNGAPTATQGYLYAWNPATSSQAWRIPQGGPWNGGVLATAGNLLFAGAVDGRFVAYRATDGQALWSMPINTGAVAGPISYAVDGEQYIAVSAGWAGAIPLVGGGLAPVHYRTEARMLAFKLGGRGLLPPPAQLPPPGRIPDMEMTAEDVAQGAALYADYCSNCHGGGVVSGGITPDLRRMPAESHITFNDIVLNGTKMMTGMPPFGDTLTPADATAIHAYIVREARAHPFPEPEDRPAPENTRFE